MGPFGWWPAAWRAPRRAEHRRDASRTVAALVWQVLTFLLPMGLMLGMWASVAPAALLWIVLFVYLLRDTAEEPGGLAAPGTVATDASAAD